MVQGVHKVVTGWSFSLVEVLDVLSMCHNVAYKPDTVVEEQGVSPNANNRKLYTVSSMMETPYLGRYEVCLCE